MSLILYNKIGSNYDFTRKADPYILGRIIYHLSIKHGENYLDLACGSGNYSILFANLIDNIAIHAIDCSSAMLKIATQKNQSQNILIKWKLGDAHKLCYKDNYFEGIFCVNAIHHFQNKNRVFKEAYRVLRKNGRFVVFTSTREQRKGYWINAYFPEAMKKSVEQLESKENIENLLYQSGFRNLEFEFYEIKKN